MDNMHDNAPGQKSSRELLSEIGRLFLKLLWAVLRKILRLMAKGVLATIAGISALCVAIKAWWNDKSTQEKIRFLRIKARIFARKSWAFSKVAVRHARRLAVKGYRLAVKYLILGLIATWKGLVWLFFNTIQAIIHLRSTLIRLWHWRKVAAKKLTRIINNARRASRLRTIRRKRAWRKFQDNGGMKGAMQRTASAMNHSIQMFMEEEQNEATPDSVTEDDIFAEEMEQNEHQSKARMIGKKLFEGMKDVVDVDEKIKS